MMLLLVLVLVLMMTVVLLLRLRTVSQHPAPSQAVVQGCGDAHQASEIMWPGGMRRVGCPRQQSRHSAELQGLRMRQQHYQLAAEIPLKLRLMLTSLSWLRQQLPREWRFGWPRPPGAPPFHRSTRKQMMQMMMARRRQQQQQQGVQR